METWVETAEEHLRKEIFKLKEENRGLMSALRKEKAVVRKNGVKELEKQIVELEGEVKRLRTNIGFHVLDAKTGETPNLEAIALEEEWAKDLVYCDMEGFALLEDGGLILLDECGNYRNCPEGRFIIVPEERNGRN